MELEGKVADLLTELSMKDETINKYVSRLQCFCEKLKEHAKQTNEVIIHPMINDQNCDVSVSFIILICIQIETDSDILFFLYFMY